MPSTCPGLTNCIPEDANQISVFKVPPPEEIARIQQYTRMLFGEQAETRISFIERIDWGPSG